jgi:hypothetical protein
MTTIIDSLLGNSSLTVGLFTGIITGIYAVTVFAFFTKRRKVYQERKQSFFLALLKGFENKVIADKIDILNIYKGITNSPSGETEYSVGLNSWLRQFLVDLYKRSNDLGITAIQLSDIKTKVTATIKEFEEIAPYSELPNTEKNLLTDISSYLNIGDKDSIIRKLKELQIVIQTRYQESIKLQNSNKWSIPLAIIGVILTIIFGSISIIK